MTEISLWDRLSDINCAAHVEKKGKFNYLSWAWAWAALKKSCPDATSLGIYLTASIHRAMLM